MHPLTQVAVPALLLQASGSEEGQTYLVITLVISILSLLVAAGFAKYVMAQDTGTADMQKVSNAIKEGAEAFLKRQNTTILGLTVVLAVLIFIGYKVGKPDDPHIALRMTFSFAIGAICSVAAGFSGMWVSIRSNIRTA